MPLMIVSKQEKELIKYIRQMSFDDMYYAAGAINTGANLFKSDRAEKIKEFRKIFTYSNKEYRDI